MILAVYAAYPMIALSASASSLRDSYLPALADDLGLPGGIADGFSRRYKGIVTMCIYASYKLHGSRASCPYFLAAAISPMYQFWIAFPSPVIATVSKTSNAVFACSP